MAKQSPSYHFAPGDTVSAVGKHSQPYPWEQRKLGEIAEEVKGNSGSINNIPILTISAANGWMNQKDRFSQIIAGNELKKYTLLKKGELSYNHGNSKLAKYGTVFVQDSHDKALVPRVYHSFKMVAQNNPYFIEYLFASGLPNKELSKIVTSGARMDGLLNINKKEFFSIKLNNPSSEEQSSVAKLFQFLDKTITLHEEKHRQLERLKKALLQKMFADETGYPALRFKGFTAKWEQRKLGDITRRYDNLRVPVTASKRKHGDIPYYGANGIQDFVSGYTHDGEFILVAEDGARDPKNYPVNYVNGKIWVNNHAHVLQGIQGLANNLFLLNGIKKINIVAYLVGGSRAKLNAETLMQLSIKLPSIHEQEKIGQLFQSLDKTITLHDKKIQYLKQLKRGLLQKMFV
ncbi:restriction endonuclease subunit S [Limosilactobacillus mucosae]|uniref:restriction endonuclease subunit S n=1 Tax=Limosilactobacillus mucosae TaxID=97478 RepID=UPI0022E5A712|nr:restriction endonuclease subunit S [Limosilactobacillus mucosae]